MARAFTRTDVGDHKMANNGEKIMLSDEERDAIAAEQTATAILSEGQDAIAAREAKIAARIERDNRGAERAAAIAKLKAENEI